jgi:hypothetical protein
MEMSGVRFGEIRRLTEMIYRTRQTELQVLKSEENRLRNAASAIEAQRRITARSDHADPIRQSIGADVLWQGWLDARQRELSIELARLRARREPAEHRLRLAFGRNKVAQELARQEKSKKRDRYSDGFD